MGTYETKKMARSCLALILIATILARGTEGQPSTPPSSETQSAQTNSTDLTNSTLDQTQGAPQLQPASVLPDASNLLPGSGVTGIASALPASGGDVIPINVVPPPAPGDGIGRPEPIINGDTVNPGSQPAWMAALILRDQWTAQAEFSCGGALIAPLWVLTAAHCIVQCTTSTGGEDCPSVAIPNSVLQGGRGGAEVRIGGRLLSQPSGFARRQIEAIYVHPQYFSQAGGNMDWDVGLIKLAAPYQLSSYPAVANDVALPLLQSFVWTYGWGAYDAESQEIPDELQQASLRVVPCQSDEGPNAYCAQGRMNADGLPTQTCQGDSGGPWVQTINNVVTVVGVTSRGDDTCTDDVVFRVPRASSWIRGIVSPPAPAGCTLPASLYSSRNFNTNSANCRAGQVLRRGTSCTVGCRTGFLANAGSRTFTCSSTGRLTNPVFSCRAPAACTAPNIDGLYSDQNACQPGLRVPGTGVRCTFYCDPDWYYPDATTVACVNGVWTGRRITRCIELP